MGRVENLPKTYGEALEMGYVVYDTTWFWGYVSRVADMAEQPVLVAGGTRKGQLYVEAPSWRSTTYSHRLYLRHKNYDAIE